MTTITVNPIACAAYGYCAELLPEMVRLDEWGYPIVDAGPVPAHLLELARQAARDCPKRALLLRGARARGEPPVADVAPQDRRSGSGGISVGRPAPPR